MFKRVLFIVLALAAVTSLAACKPDMAGPNNGPVNNDHTGQGM